jgi:hypothetical protein
MQELSLAARKPVLQVKGTNRDCGPGGGAALIEIPGELFKLVRRELLGHGLAFREETTCHNQMRVGRFHPLTHDFQPAIRQTSGAVQKAHEVVIILGVAAVRTYQVKPERLGVFDSMPEVVSLAVFVAEDRYALLCKVGSHTIALETFFEHYKTELNIGHFPMVLASRHFRQLRLREALARSSQ